jgi:hypothetical protein
MHNDKLLQCIEFLTKTKLRAYYKQWATLTVTKVSHTESELYN